MTDNERIILIMRYLYNCESFYKNDYIEQLNNFSVFPASRPEEVLRLYRSRIRYEAFKEFSRNLEKILYGR